MVLAKSLQHKGRLLSIVTRVAIQINCKLGGEAWTVQMPLRVSCKGTLRVMEMLGFRVMEILGFRVMEILSLRNY